METKIYPRIKNAIVLCLVLMATQIVAGLVIGVIFRLLQINTESVVYGISIIIVNLLSFGLVILIGFKKAKQKFNEIFKFKKVALDYWLAITVFMMGFIILTSEMDNFINYLLPMPLFLQNAFDLVMVRQTFIISLILVGIVPAITEEMFFRGLILNGFTGIYSARKAIFISALLFGIIHLNPWQFFGAFIIGAFMAYILIKTKSILLCIYMHLFNNAANVIVLKYREAFPIKGFNTSYSDKMFQPVWFDVAGIVITVLGVLLLIKANKKHTIE